MLLEELTAAVAKEAVGEEEEEDMFDSVAEPSEVPEVPTVAVARPKQQIKRGQADAFMNVGGGILAFYSSKKSFQAACLGHENCVKAVVATKQPVGLLTSWLKNCGQDSKEEHWQPEDSILPQDVRQQARDEILMAPGGLALLELESKFSGKDFKVEPLDVRV